MTAATAYDLERKKGRLYGRPATREDMIDEAVRRAMRYGFDLRLLIFKFYGLNEPIPVFLSVVRREFKNVLHYWGNDVTVLERARGT